VHTHLPSTLRERAFVGWVKRSATQHVRAVQAMLGRAKCLTQPTGVLLAALSAMSVAATAAPPQRIVSLNLCVDQIIVDLVPRGRLVAVTHLAGDGTVSAVPERFKGIFATRGTAEDVLARDPDLIIAGAYTTPATVDLLRRLGRRVVVVPLPDSIEGVRQLVLAIAAAAEVPETGAALVVAMDRRIDAVRSRLLGDDRRPTAIVYQINNYVTGEGSLLDEALGIAGYRNAGRGMSTFANGQIGLEQLVGAPPDLLVLATKPDAYVTAVGDNLRHPALGRLRVQVPNMVLPWPLWLCGTHHIATAIEQLADARAGVLARLRVGQ
jgi:iron complex transport system substrate-binding protein